MLYFGTFFAAPRGFAENTLTAPNGNQEDGESRLSGLFLGTESRLLPALPELAGSGQKRLIIPKGRAGPCRGGPKGHRGRFLDRKRGFLTAFGETLSVLFGEEIRVLEDPDRDVFRDTFWSPDPGKVRIYPLKWPKAVRKVSRKRSESGQYTAILSFIDAKNRLLSLFCHRECDSGGPTRHFEEEQCSYFS